MPPKKRTSNASAASAGGNARCHKGETRSYRTMYVTIVEADCQKAYESVAQFAAAYQLGATEPAAAESLQRAVGAYLAAVDRYSELAPRAFLDKTLPEIEKSRFDFGRSSSDLSNRVQWQPAVGLAGMVSQGSAAAASVWGKSKALLGSISGIDRARVSMLKIFHTRRFSEWSSACWQLQKNYLLESDLELDVQFLALYDNDSAHHLTSTRDCLLGRAMDEWWDHASEAGPKSREATRFGEDAPSLEVLSIAADASTVSNLGI
eukprot:s4806_g2.t1